MSNSIVVGGMYVTPTVDISRSVATITGAAGSVVVPPGESWQILSATATVTTSDTVGNRTHALQVLDGAVVVDQTIVGANLAASQSNTLRNFTQNVTASSGVNVPLRPQGMFAAGGNTVRVFDVAAIDADDDTMSVRIQVLKFYGG